MTELIKVFVYGTLKPGEANHHYCKDHLLKAEAAFVYGQLYDLPLGYPAMTAGQEPVYGFLLAFAEPSILNQLDELEDYDPRRPAEQNEYMRVQTTAFDLQKTDLGLVWVYQMRLELVQKARGVPLPHGRWTGRSNAPIV